MTTTAHTTRTASRASRPTTGRLTGPLALTGIGAFSCLVVALQQTLVIPAVPQFGTLLGATATQVGWLVTITLLTGAVATPILGRLSDLRGKRRMGLIAMGFVLVGSVLAPLGGIELVIVGRALQGVGTALVPIAMAQMRDSLSRERIPAALAVLSATLGVGGSIGIPLGGVILQTLGWRAVFVVSALLAVAALVLLLLAFPPSHPDDDGTFDVPGALLFAVALSALLLVVSQGNTWGWTSPVILVLLAVGVLVAVLWGVFELRHASPLVDLRTTGSRPLLMTNLASVVMGVLMFTNLLHTTLTLQNPRSEGGFEWGAGAAGLVMLPSALAMLGVAVLTARLARRYGPRVVLILGAAVTGGGYLLRLLVTPNAPLAIVWTTVISIGTGIGYAALPMLVARYAPLHEMGAANGVNALMRAIGSAIASSIVTAITAAFAVRVGGGAVPSASALALIAGLGIALSAVAAGFAWFARSRVEEIAA